KKIDITLITDPKSVQVVKNIATAFGDLEPALLHLVWLFRSAFRKRQRVHVVTSPAFFECVDTLVEFGLIEYGGMSKGPDREVRICSITESGRNFLLRLKLHPGIKGAYLRFVKLFAGLLLFFMEERAACCGR